MTNTLLTTESLTDEFKRAQANALGHDDLAQVALAAMGGRAATLLIDADRQIPGKLDVTSGLVTLADASDPQVDDLLDDLGDLVVGKGGQVLVVPAERMPTLTGLAAIYRY